MPINWDNVGNPADTLGVPTPQEYEDLLGMTSHNGDKISFWNADPDTESTSTNPSTGFQADMQAARQYAASVNPFAMPAKRAEYMQNYVDKQYQLWLATHQNQLMMQDLKEAGINPYYLFSGGSSGNISPVQSNVSGSSGSGAARLLALMMMLLRIGSKAL